MKLTLARNPGRLGCTDEWTARFSDAPEGTRPGIGKTRSDALGALLSANLELFGISERLDLDPLSELPECRWTAGATGEPPALSSA